MRLYSSLLFVAALLTLGPLRGQTPAFPQLSFPADQLGTALALPFAGGLNAPQFSTADLNNDGDEDLVVFDRAGDILLTFLHTGGAGSDAYEYAPQYAAHFPLLQNWVQLRDYNHDGAADIFAASTDPGTQEIQVFRGYYDNNVLKFQQFWFSYPGCASCNPKFIWYPDDLPGFWNNLSVSRADLPEFNDIDGDGDLDILTFEASVGGHVWWIANTSVESGFNDDSLHFELRDECWGDFYESGLEQCRNCLSPSTDVCTNGSLCVPGAAGPAAEDRHPGSTLMTFDNDGDGDMEIVLGDISFACLNMMTNGGTPQNAWMIAQDTAFPTYDVPVNIQIFPSPFYLDVNHDGRGDFIAAPNNKTIGEDQKAVWYYANTASNGHAFELQTQGFLIEDMIDLGTASHPTLADVNGDGLLDIVAGNYGYYTYASPNNASLYLYLNIGTAAEPHFQLTETDWLGMAQFAPNEFDFTPTFGDLDSDGDLDLLVGANGGILFHYRNTAGAGNPMQLTLDTDLMWTQMDVGVASAPAIFDVDADGLNDVVVGERNGNLNYFRNVGSPTQALFTAAPTLTNLGAISATPPGEIVGFSTPLFVTTPDDGTLLLVGSNNGQINVYSGIAPVGTAFNLVAGHWGQVDVGNRNSPAIADLNNDGQLELLAGNLRGGLSLYATDLSTVSATDNPVGSSLHIQLQPNPADTRVHVSLSGAGASGMVGWRVLNTLGQETLRGTAFGAAFDLTGIERLDAGLYFVELTVGGQRGLVRLVVK